MGSLRSTCRMTCRPFGKGVLLELDLRRFGARSRLCGGDRFRGARLRSGRLGCRGLRRGRRCPGRRLGLLDVLSVQAHASEQRRDGASSQSRTGQAGEQSSCHSGVLQQLIRLSENCGIRLARDGTGTTAGRLGRIPGCPCCCSSWSRSRRPQHPRRSSAATRRPRRGRRWRSMPRTSTPSPTPGLPSTRRSRAGASPSGRARPTAPSVTSTAASSSTASSIARTRTIPRRQW